MARPLVLDLDDPRWEAFVQSRPEATAFHLPVWSQLLADCYRLRAFGFALEVDGVLVSGVPVVETRSLTGKLRWVALPFTDAVAPLGAPERTMELARALNRSCSAQSLDSIEIRCAVALGSRVVRGLSHMLSLSADPHELLSTFSRSQVQRNITRSEREGVQVRVAQREEDLLETFYDLHLHTRVRQGVPVQPRRFFTLLWERVLTRGLGYALVAEVADRPIASAVFLSWNRTVIYKFGASDRAAWGARPNHALFWCAIRRACEEGMREFDFGRTDPENEGLRAFKAAWGTKERPLVYTVLGEAGAEADRERLTSTLRIVIRHSPPWVCRMIGEMLYRYAA